MSSPRLKYLLIALLFIIVVVIASMISFMVGYNKANDEKDNCDSSNQTGEYESCDSFTGTEKDDCLSCVYKNPLTQTTKTGDKWTLLGCVDTSK